MCIDLPKEEEAESCQWVVDGEEGCKGSSSGKW